MTANILHLLTSIVGAHSRHTAFIEQTRSYHVPNLQMTSFMKGIEQKTSEQ